MLRDHRALMVTFADKVAVRDHVVKPSHGSGVAVIVSPTAPADARLPPPQHGWVYSHVRPEHAPVEHLVALGHGWLSQLYGQGPNREWAYGHVPRRVVVEEFLGGPGGDVPDDYKFFVFHGTCRYVQVDLYDLPGRIVFGEMSSLPAGGDSPFEPGSRDLPRSAHAHAPPM